MTKRQVTREELHAELEEIWDSPYGYENFLNKVIDHIETIELVEGKVIMEIPRNCGNCFYEQIQCPYQSCRENNYRNWNISG